MFKLALNAGHGLNTAGKRCMKSIDLNETREWVLNSRICNKIEEKLSSYNGIEILRTDDTTGAVDKTIATRAKNANSFGADLYLSIHHNAGINGGSGGGIMAFTYLSVDAKTTEWQSAFYNAAIAHSGLKGNRVTPLAKQDLGECRQTAMPAVLMECGFMDSATDTPIILTEQFAEQLATAFVEVIVKFSGITLKNLAQTTTTSKAQLYRVRKSWKDAKSQTGAYKVLDNAIKKAQSTGCNVYDTKGNCVWSNSSIEKIETSINTTTENMDEETNSEKFDTSSSGILNLIYSILKKFLKK